MTAPTASPDRTITVAGVPYRVEPGRYVLVLRGTITTTADAEAVFEAPEDILVEHILAWSEDAGGLATCRVGWKGNAGRDEDFYAPEKTGAITYPIASTLFTDAAIYTRDVWNIVFPKAKLRTFVFQNAGGSPPYDVELTFRCRRLTRMD